MQLGLAFWSAKTLLSAVELGVFSELARQALDALALQAPPGLHPRNARGFLRRLSHWLCWIGRMDIMLIHPKPICF